MKNLKKSFLILIIILISIIKFPTEVKAASGSLSISASNTAIVGNTVTVTVTLSSSSALGCWQFDVNYDTSYLQLTSSDADNGGTYFVACGNGSSKSKTYTLKFRALKSGSTNITIGSYMVVDFNTQNEMSITRTNKKITLMTQKELEATYSKDNNLKSLTVEGYELKEEFNKDTLEYNVDVPTGTTSVKITATPNDKTAIVTGDGEIEVSEGLNTIKINVTAQNGDQKEYTLTVNVEDQNPIEVSVDNETYVVIKTASLLTAPATFMETTVTIDDFEIPAFVNNAANITLVGLKDNSGNISLFQYKDDKYSKYTELNLKNYLLIPSAFEEELNLIKTSIKIENITYDAYKYSENSDFIIISAKSLEDGKTNLYLYDTVNKTASRYDADYINEINSTITNYTYVIIAFAGALFLMLIIIFSLLHSLRKKQKKINKFVEKQEAKIEATRKLNNVIDEVKKITEAEKIVKEKKEEEPQEEIKVKELKINEEDKKEDKEEEKEKTPEPKKEEKELPKKDLDETEVYDIFEDDYKFRKKNRTKKK